MSLGEKNSESAGEIAKKLIQKNAGNPFVGENSPHESQNSLLPNMVGFYWF